MQLVRENNGIRFLWVSLMLILVDQLTKYGVIYFIPQTQFISLDQPFFSLVHVYNEGAAWSFLSNMGGWQRYFFILIALVVSIALIISLLRIDKKQKWSCLAISLVIGGAIGNLIDRVVLSHVVDFLLFHFKFDSLGINYFYPAFNIADIGVTVGAFLLVIIGFFGKEDKKQ